MLLSLPGFRDSAPRNGPIGPQLCPKDDFTQRKRPLLLVSLGVSAVASLGVSAWTIFTVWPCLGVSAVAK